MKLKSAMLLFLLLSNIVMAEKVSKNNAWGVFSDTPTAYFKMTRVQPYKGTYDEALKYLLLLDKKNNLKNNFCTLGLEWGAENRNAIVFWREGRMLFIWNLEGYDENYYYSSLALGEFISLTENVFPSAVLKENPYAYMQAYSQEAVDSLMEECTLHGENVTIHAFSQPQKCDDGSEIEYEYNIKNEHLCDAIQLRDYSRDSATE